MADQQTTLRRAQTGSPAVDGKAGQAQDDLGQPSWREVAQEHGQLLLGRRLGYLAQPVVQFGFFSIGQHINLQSKCCRLGMATDDAAYVKDYRAGQTKMCEEKRTTP